MRDAVLIGGYKLIVPRGYELSVSFAGKAATWILYASLAFMLATPEGTDFPYVLFWIGSSRSSPAPPMSSARSRSR